MQIIPNNFWKTSAIICPVYIITGSGHRYGDIVTSCDTKQIRKQSQNGDTGYMLL